jgi:negative regulator of sigma E activity
MSLLEDQLRESLRRQEAPDGFAGRVMERIRRGDAADQAQARAVARPMPAWRGAWFRFAVLATCALLVVTVGVFQVRREREEHRRMDAERAFEALQLTAGKLRSVRARIVNVGLARKAEDE